MIRFLLPLIFLSLNVVTAQTWTPAADLPSGRHHPIGWGLDGKGYVATGTNSAGQPTDDFYEYDPASDSWSTLPDFAGPDRSFAIGVAYKGMGYLGFGASLIQYFNDLWRYDPNSGQWTQMAACPCSGRRHPAMVAHNDKIYVGLGDNGSGNLRDWWVYDINANSWSQLPNLPAPARHHPFQFVAGGQVFAGMGHGGPVIYNDWYKLDTLTNNWVIMNAFQSQGRVAGTQFDHDGYGYVLSGDGNNHSYMATGEFWQYDPTGDSWTQLTPHPGISRWAPGSFVLGNDVYFFGGENRQTQQNPVDMWKFQLTSSSVSLAEAEQPAIKLYPNPANRRIQWTSDEEFSEVRLINSLGQEVLSAVQPQKSLELPNMSGGMYIVQFWQSESLLHTERILIQR